MSKTEHHIYINHLECRYDIYIYIHITYVFIRVISEVFKFVFQHHAAFWISNKGEISKKRPSINLPLGRLIEGQRVNPFTCNTSVVINDKWYTKPAPLFFSSWTLLVSLFIMLNRTQKRTHQAIGQKRTSI